MKKYSILQIFILLSFSLLSQEYPADTADTLRQHAINVYMDNVPSYIKREVPFVNYVRDKKVADLIIIETMQQTGSGGAELTFFIEGQFDSIYEPEVRVNGEEIIVDPENYDIHLHPGFNVDQEKSTVSYRNGIIEIIAVKSESTNVSEGILRIE